ncbi:hypothetical protein GCM10020254_09180 [Streptomyces goshikiensis]
MACLRMALLRRDGHAPSLFDLLDGARAYGAYTEDADTAAIRGLIYAPFAAYARAEHGLTAEVHGRLPAGRLAELLDAGQGGDGLRPQGDPPARPSRPPAGAATSYSSPATRTARSASATPPGTPPRPATRNSRSTSSPPSTPNAGSPSADAEAPRGTP